MSVELLTAHAQPLLKTARQDGENIRALARIAENRERRITTLAGGDPSGT